MKKALVLFIAALVALMTAMIGASPASAQQHKKTEVEPATSIGRYGEMVYITDSREIIERELGKGECNSEGTRCVYTTAAGRYIVRFKDDAAIRIRLDSDSWVAGRVKARDVTSSMNRVENLFPGGQIQINSRTTSYTHPSGIRFVYRRFASAEHSTSVVISYPAFPKSKTVVEGKSIPTGASIGDKLKDAETAMYESGFYLVPSTNGRYFEHADTRMPSVGFEVGHNNRLTKIRWSESTNLESSWKTSKGFHARDFASMQRQVRRAYPNGTYIPPFNTNFVDDKSGLAVYRNCSYGNCGYKGEIYDPR